MWRLNSEELSMRNLLNFFKLMGENDTGAHTSLVARVKKKITKNPLCWRTIICAWRCWKKNNSNRPWRVVSYYHRRGLRGDLRKARRYIHGRKATGVFKSREERNNISQCLENLAGLKTGSVSGPSMVTSGTESSWRQINNSVALGSSPIQDLLLMICVMEHRVSLVSLLTAHSWWTWTEHEPEKHFCLSHHIPRYQQQAHWSGWHDSA